MMCQKTSTVVLQSLLQESYTVYVVESVPVGESLLQVNAVDADRNARLAYEIVEPISARDRTGNTLTNKVGLNFYVWFFPHNLSLFHFATRRWKRSFSSQLIEYSKLLARTV